MNSIKEIQKLECLINEKMKSNNVTITILGSEEENKGQIIILKDGKFNKEFKIEMISHAQVDIIEKGMIIERGLFIDNLGKWLFNLYNQTEYEYQFCGGKLNGMILSREALNEISNGLTEDYSKERATGTTVHRKELDNQPKVKGYLGPMYNGIDYGIIHLRYETQEVYDMLST